VETLRSLEYAVVDVETTGGSAANGHRITEIAVVVLRGDGEVLDSYSSLVNPGRPIPPFVSRLTGITDSMVRVAPPFAEVAEEVRSHLRGRIFVAHNVAFDWGFVNRELSESLGSPLEGRRLCTVRLARRVVPELKSRSLGTLSDFFGIENAARHRALGDAEATVQVFGHLLSRLEDHEIWSWDGLEELLARGISRSRRRTTNGRSRRI
jgi:DNA polymerase-3 subunit epsilon